MYHLAPHSPYDPLHLVPKLLNQAVAQGLDSRGAFVIHVLSAIYVWIGKSCVSVMADKARALVFQIIRYEMALGPVVTIENGNSKFSTANSPCIGQKKVDMYDMDLEVFHKALAGGVIPPFPLSGTEFETSLPTRGIGWSRLTSLIRIDDTCKEVEHCVPLTNPPLSPASSCISLEFFSSSLVGNPNLSSKSPSLSPSLSDFSSSFTFSSTSSNWSHLSSQISPPGMQCPNPYPANNVSQAETACLVSKGTSTSLTKAFFDNHALKEANICLPYKKTTLSIAERRGSNPPARMMLPTASEPSWRRMR
ncbi:protein-tyrosine-phosphatase MKP1-like [Actinidia eriantha]|uniref:protein-tyrosine-phosphatase MKP1-like n=1 Tax=Actinidia eriantha TaxID=165200 RepID=UPI00259123B9|nr:protein-tyrosine-phosphatase MKP1-like [Actinidia eriantha]